MQRACGIKIKYLKPSIKNHTYKSQTKSNKRGVFMFVALPSYHREDNRDLKCHFVLPVMSNWRQIDEKAENRYFI